MNNDFYKNVDENFEQAYNLSNKNYTHSELIELLKNGNIPQKQIAALKFDYVQNEEDANALLSNLTGCDGKIREAVALRINQLLNESDNVKDIFCTLSADILADATIDINANICRLAVDSAVLLKYNETFSVKYTKKLIQFTIDALDELDKFIFRDKKYVINKQLFKLYWCLDGIKYFQDYIDKTILEKILTKCVNQREYTIREKAAQVIAISNKFDNLKDKLATDENYYVRTVFNSTTLYH